ncbi:hypothetical protein BGZ80_009488 [Entomortierella chlamydospora]|uniref:Uncharacterized protein n=1 Tax=Entomortierella chlamydospora TaxID=101097 RepID=A0A9P6T0H1_9FUNG|nr:hypothetical protein BGZ80_009488 [Entomortierella chlamydospora]
MTPAFAPTAIDSPAQSHYDPYYSHPPSSSSSYRHHSQHSRHSPSAHSRELSPRPHHYPQSSYSMEQRYSHQREYEHEHEDERQRSHPSHPSQEYYHSQRQQEQAYPPHPQSPPRRYSPSHSNPNNYHSEARRSYSSYPDPYSYPQPTVRHSEGYEGRPRNTNRDHNDHLLADDRHANAHDHQQHSDQYQRDSSGYIKHQPSQYPPSHPDRPHRPIGDDLNKFHLPPIQAPEEPFYRKDLPGRHMRYFRNVTSQDREDRHGYYSSARHVAPSNTTGNFGHGPSIGAALDRFGARQTQQYEEPQGYRLPTRYAAQPEQRPAPYTPSESGSSEQSSPLHGPNSAVSPSHHRLSYSHYSPSHSPIEKPLNYGRQQQQFQSHPYHPHQHQAVAPQQNKPKAIQPRSIAPAPVSSNPASPVMQQPALSPHSASKRTDRQIYVKIEPKEQSYYQPMSQSPPMHMKRKWEGDHSPPRRFDAPPLDPMDESSQELHLLSRRSQQSRPVQSTDGKRNHQKTRMQRYQMTTIRCWHGAIAQKSYGIEKRYLCPPPMVHVSAGVNAKQIRADQPHVVMSVIHEKITGPQTERLMEQDCSLDDNLKCSFRNLHVTGTGSDSSKRFKLGVQVYLNKHAAMPTAVMDSNPIPIISKPSKKTANAGNASCFILNGMSVSLLNRINAQTVRTKYMAVDNNAVCAKIGSWSSFTIKMVKPPPAPPVKAVSASIGVFKAPGNSTKFVPIRMKGDPSDPAQGQSVPMARSLSNQKRVEPTTPSPTSSSFHFRHQQQLQPQPQPQQEPVYNFSNSEPVLYGSEIVLINDLTGIMTDRLIIRKVENGKVSRSGTGPVSQMQKIVLEHPDRVHPEDGRAYYLSASSIGSPKIEGKIPLQAAMDRSPLLEYRTSSKKASIMDMTDAQDDEEDELNDEEGDYNGQNNSMPRRVSKSQDCVAVDDFVCWTIAGIAKFDYTYFSPIPASVDSDVNLSKVPTVLACPRFNPHSNSLTMPVKNVLEKLSPEEEARILKQNDDPYDRKQSMSEFVYKRCEDVRQPMRDEEGPIQLWLAQHGPIRIRRRNLSEVVSPKDEEQLLANYQEDEEDEPESGESDTEDNEESAASPEDRLPKIATKSIAPKHGANQPKSGQQSIINAANGRYYGGSHLPASLRPGQKQKRVKVLRRPMGLEAELPIGQEVRAAHDAHGNARAELDILMVEHATGIAYRTGFKVVYSRERERADWIVEIVG